MALSKLFKKSSNELSQVSLESKMKIEIFGSPDLQKYRVDAATKVMGLFDRYFKPSEGYVHPETVLFSAAWLSGGSLYRSFNFTHKGEPGTIVLSEEANQEWPKLMNIFLYYAQRDGITLQPNQIILKIPEEHMPQKTIIEIQKDLQDQYYTIMKMHGLDFTDGARAGIIVCSMLFNYHCTQKKEIDHKLGVGIIGRGILEGAKTCPWPLNPQKAKEEEIRISQSAKSNVSRFVIGALGDVLEDVKKNGGQYQQLHPLVEAKLKEGKFDIKIIYIKGLENQLEEKVSRVDFINMNLEKLLCQDEKEQISIPAYLAHWLQNNAKKYGYKREGNSWVLLK